MSTRKKERVKTVLRRFDYGNTVNLEFTYHSSKALKKFKKQLSSDIKNSKSLDYGNYDYYKFLCVVLKNSDYKIKLNSEYYPFYVILSFDISKLYQSFFSELPNSRSVPHLRWEDNKYAIYDGYREVNNARKILNEYNSKIFSAKAELNDFIVSINVKELLADLWDHLYEEISLEKYKPEIRKMKKGSLTENLWYQKKYRPPWYYSLFKCLKKAKSQEDLKKTRIF